MNNVSRLRRGAQARVRPGQRSRQGIRLRLPQHHGAQPVGSLQRVAPLVLCASLALPALACDVPDEGGNTPWRRAVAKVRYLPEIEAWADARARDSHLVKYVLSLDEPRRSEGYCWWPVAIYSEGRLWRRFLVTPDGNFVREEPAPTR